MNSVAKFEGKSEKENRRVRLGDSVSVSDLFGYDLVDTWSHFLTG